MSRCQSVRVPGCQGVRARPELEPATMELVLERERAEQKVGRRAEERRSVEERRALEERERLEERRALEESRLWRRGGHWRRGRGWRIGRGLIGMIGLIYASRPLKMDLRYAIDRPAITLI